MKKLILSMASLVLAFAAFSETVNVRWPANPAAQQVSSYSIFVATNGTSNPGQIGSSTTTNFTTTLPAGATYYFTVKAVNLAGTGASSSPAATPGLPSAPATPSLTTTENSASLSWSPNPAEQQVSSYGVFVATNGTSNPVLLATVSTTSYTTPLNQGFQYFFTLKANNMAGQSVASNPASTPSLPSAPGTPIIEISP